MTLLSVEQAAERLHCHPKTLAAWRRKQYGPKCIKRGGRYFYDEQSLLAWLAEQEQNVLHGNPNEKRKTRVPLSATRQIRAGADRFGGHATKQTTSRSNRGRTPRQASKGNADWATAASPHPIQ